MTTIGQQLYRKQFDKGIAGLLYDIRYKSQSTFNSDADMPFGRMCFRVPATDGKVQLPSDTVLPKNVAGVSLRTQVIENQALFIPPDTPAYPTGAPVNVLDKGRIYVYTEQAVVVGDPVFYRFAANAGANEVQEVNPDAVPLQGTFTLSFDGEETDPLAFNANAATVQAALEALSTIGAGNVTVTGSLATVIAVEFVGVFAESSPGIVLVADGTNLSSTVPVSEIQTLTPSEVPTKGSTKLSIGTDLTALLAFNASAATIQAELETIVGAGLVTVTGGFETAVVATFDPSLGDVAAIGTDTNTLAKADDTPVTLATVETQKGVAPHAVDLSTYVEVPGEAPGSELGVFRKDADDASGDAHAADANAVGSGKRFKWFAGTDAASSFAVLEVE